MMTLFKHPSGRLRVTRIALTVFLVMLAGFAIAHKMGKSAEKVLVSIEHVFEPSKPEPAATPPEPETVTRPVEKPAPEPVAAAEPDKTSSPADKPDPQELAKQELAKQEPKPDLTKQELAKQALAKEELVKQELAKQELAKEEMAKQASLNTMPAKETVTKTETKEAPPKDTGVSLGDTQKLMDDSVTKEKPQKEALSLPSEEYFEVYKQWQVQGKSLDKDKKLVALRIQNLEKVYELFQMKVVALKSNQPHTDLGDGSRVAGPSLEEFSTTCFVVSDPWEKWGEALKGSGFSKGDDIQVRYYTYDFVRNAIYARAMKAFEYSLAKKGLPGTTDPSQADVLGEVYTINKNGGGQFGVFVPKRVDFQSQGSVEIDPMACFKGQKDIEALYHAGLL